MKVAGSGRWAPGFAQKVLVSDPLPPSAALPLYQGESGVFCGFTVPLGKGDSREAAGGRSHAMPKSTFCAKPRR
jgi:hypothetical protein